MFQKDNTPTTEVHQALIVLNPQTFKPGIKVHNGNAARKE